MHRKRGVNKGAVIGLLLVALFVTITVFYFHKYPIDVLSPHGIIALRERRLLIIALLLSAIVVLPVYAIAIAIVFRYRAGGKKTVKYHPDWDHSWLLETVWWGIPIVIIAVLSVITWQSSHELDPFKPLASTVKPVPVQVVALDWKWLFIYPEQHIASVNMLEIPVSTPADFTITSDSVMNSFWIPNLGGQIYAMPGMSTQLHLMANKTGNYHGSPANISGKGFSEMNFTAKVVSDGTFKQWVKTTQKSPLHLDLPTYTGLAKPSIMHSPVYYSSPSRGLYDYIIMKYMGQVQ